MTTLEMEYDTLTESFNCVQENSKCWENENYGLGSSPIQDTPKVEVFEVEESLEHIIQTNENIALSQNGIYDTVDENPLSICENGNEWSTGVEEKDPFDEGKDFTESEYREIESISFKKETTEQTHLNYAYDEGLQNFNMEFKSGVELFFEDKNPSQKNVFVCEICHRVFGSEYKLESHLFKIHKVEMPKKISSPKKSESNKSDWPLNIHDFVRKENGVRTYYCNMCTYQVCRSDSMRKHVLRVHSAGKEVSRYQCEVCGKTFVDGAYLRNHSVTHQTERQFQCVICDRSFHRHASLKRHMQGHSAEKQYACTLCEYQTNRKHLMYRHTENHRTGRAYTCRHCDAQFFTQLSLRSHLYEHNVTPNTCSFCRVCFSSRDRMMCHMQKLHFDFEIKDLKDVYIRSEDAQPVNLCCDETEETAELNNINSIEIKVINIKEDEKIF